MRREEDLKGWIKYFSAPKTCQEVRFGETVRREPTQDCLPLSPSLFPHWVYRLIAGGSVELIQDCLPKSPASLERFLSDLIQVNE